MGNIGNYCGDVEAVLKSIPVDVGDRVRVTKGNQQPKEGILMPGDKGGQTDHVVIKLDKGYNIGIEVTERTSVEKIQDKDD